MKTTITLCVILVAAILGLGDAASLPADNRENNDMLSEMADIQRALNQAATPSNEYMEELKDQPTQSDENVMAERLNAAADDNRAEAEGRRYYYHGGYKYGHKYPYHGGYKYGHKYPYHGGYKYGHKYPYHGEAQTENIDMLSEMADIQRALNQADTPSNEYMEEHQPTQSDVNVMAHRVNVLSQEDKQFLEELKNQPDKNELADRLDVLSQGGSSSGDNISQGDAVAFQTYVRIKYIGCASTYCTPTSGPGLYMNTYDWYTNPTAGFEIYRMNGKGNIKVGEVIAIYYPKEKKWMKCSGSYCTKDTCPGNPSQGNGMQDYEKWIGCSESVFKIYASGRNDGDNVRRGDEIALYHVKDRKWVSAETSYIQKNTCLGTSRPPSSHYYDTCYKEVFELFKR